MNAAMTALVSGTIVSTPGRETHTAKASDGQHTIADTSTGPLPIGP